MNENKKSNEELADEALAAVTGGNGRGTQGATCPKCQTYVHIWRAEKRDGKYYCPNCHTVELPLGRKEVSR